MSDQGTASKNGELPKSILAHRPGTIRISLAPNDSAPTRARRALEEIGGDLDEGVRERSSVVISELVTNCIKHAGLSELEQIEVEIAVRPDLVRVGVTDPGDGFEIVAQRPGEEDGSGGWGLWLIERMTDRWGVDFSHNTNIWAEIDRS
jgi:anti-sigma regulatory factor (Ser/Thr protein kinase)